AIQKYQIAVIAYCLMPNHYHFLLRQEVATRIDELMQSVFTGYVKAFNKAHKRSGTLFEGPFQAKHVKHQDYLLHLCRYIHRNPIDASLVRNIEEWEFSNYHEWIGKRDGAFVDTSFVKGHFASSSDYQDFVLNYEPPKKVADELKPFLFD
ncbi:MAG TPA: transposase, partial [Bacteroidota bacterium]|nr:transposase [Bacteroidota bacterium]